MQVTRTEPPKAYRPVVFTLESEKELNMLYTIINLSNPIYLTDDAKEFRLVLLPAIRAQRNLG